MDLKPGIYPNVSFPDYRAIKAVNHHTLWRLREECPANAKYEMENGSQETEALAFGSLTDFILLEPGRFQAKAAVEPEIGDGKAPRRPTKRQVEAKNPSAESVAAIEFWQAWDLENDGKFKVSRADYEKVMQIAAQVRSVQCQDYICGGRSQVVLIWQDPETKLMCKARLDYERYAGFNHLITDLKTARSAHPDYWQFAIYKYGYFQQFAWYNWGWKMLTGEDSICGWLIAEKHAYCGVVYQQAHEEAMEAGVNAFRPALDRFSECDKKDEWPFYESGIVNLPRWALEREGVSRYRLAPKEFAGSRINEVAETFEEAYGLEE